MAQRERFYLQNEKTTLAKFATKEEAVQRFNLLDSGQYSIALVCEETNREYCDWDCVVVLGYIDPLDRKYRLLEKPVWRNPLTRKQNKRDVFSR